MIAHTFRRQVYIRTIAILILISLSGSFTYTLLASRSEPIAPQTTQTSDNVASSPALSPPKAVVIGSPLRLLIPKLDVDANILHLGLTAEGNMDVPTDLVNTGWYKYGPRPGSTGSAVIAGHLEGPKEKGVFTNLDTLTRGDRISVNDDAGNAISFTVTKIQSYRQEERPAEVFNNTDGSHLNLITCAGIWNATQQRYSQRLVVFTDKVT